MPKGKADDCDSYDCQADADKKFGIHAGQYGKKGPLLSRGGTDCAIFIFAVRVVCWERSSPDGGG